MAYEPLVDPSEAHALWPVMRAGEALRDISGERGAVRVVLDPTPYLEVHGERVDVECNDVAVTFRIPSWSAAFTLTWDGLQTMVLLLEEVRACGG